MEARISTTTTHDLVEGQQLRALSAALLARRDVILEQWRAAGQPSPENTIASSLSRAQFNDHVPAVLDCFAETIEALPGSSDVEAIRNQVARVAEHGLQRWQQGYQLRELIREWGHLQIVVARELEEYAAAHPETRPAVMTTARLAWAQLCADGVTESATQYWRLHQAESAGHVNDLQMALSVLNDMERTRAEVWRVAAHDLRGSVTVVQGATALLNTGTVMDDPVRVEASEMLNKSVGSLYEMLNDLLSLARLEAGHEQRQISQFDAAELLQDFCRASRAAAEQRGLYLKVEGVETLPVEGDKAKVLRILQNLVLNALKYTERGGISVIWGVDRGRDTDRWTFSVQDTGPGIDANDFAPFAQELHDATGAADEARDASTDRRRDIAAAVTLPSATSFHSATQAPGEGVGLTIVKRLCELIDAGLELATSPGHGSTFRVILPRRYH